jgi:Flp pilus assembly pilin Flp
MVKRLTSGQALVEYALILVLVTLAVVAVLALLGPSIAQAFNNVTNQITTSPNPSPSPTPSWTFCVNEGGTCVFAGAKQVRYGKNTTWVYGTFTNSVACTNGTFGDPLFGTLKECDIR